jgi:hypothetical protein
MVIDNYNFVGEKCIPPIKKGRATIPCLSLCLSNAFVVRTNFTIQQNP